MLMHRRRKRDGRAPARHLIMRLVKVDEAPPACHVEIIENGVIIMPIPGCSNL